MKKTNTTTQYKFENGLRGQIDTYDSMTTDITIFNEENKVIFSETLDQSIEFVDVLSKLVEEGQKCQ